ncbi:MAG TPA: ATP-binding protein [Hyphomonadaceae bacterium]|nr:ATPase AAA [Hyphomonadaceae bacterium UKL13-1]HCP64756.1 ATP-binding protein [Hyphomonadaceae bacterium]
MTIDAWLPVDFELPNGPKLRSVMFGGTSWQIFETHGNGRALVVHEELALRWVTLGLIDRGLFSDFDFGQQSFRALSCGQSHDLSPVSESNRPQSKAEALAFAQALKATREIDPTSPIHDALYVEKISRLLPTYSITSRLDDDVVLGSWLTGGAFISAKSFRRLRQTMSWLNPDHLSEVVQLAGFEVSGIVPGSQKSQFDTQTDSGEAGSTGQTIAETARDSKTKEFELAGRPELAAFFNEHIVDIVLRRDQYKLLGIEFPSAVILYGPPGTGKTFAVEQLVDFLGWPSFQIDASSVASPYIHETSKKVAQVFEKAIENAPSVLVIDEMEAFLADREMTSSHHRVEEVAEFLRRIPEAIKCDVLIIAMTNRLDMIDPAIQRRGRFDHVVKVDFASEVEVRALLDKLISSIPRDEDVDTIPIARELAGRPLSDVAFVVREGARLAARAGKERIDQVSLIAALQSAPAREREGETLRRIGF